MNEEGMAIVERTSELAGAAGTGAPGEVYAARQERFARERDALAARWNRVANLRLLAFVVAAACAGGAIKARSLPIAGLALVAFVAFLILVRHHARLGAARRRAEELRAINEEAVWRLRREWARIPLRS